MPDREARRANYRVSSQRYPNRTCGPCVLTDDVKAPRSSLGAGERVAHVVTTRLTDIGLTGIDPITDRVAGKRFG